jgi:signal peptidase II
MRNISRYFVRYQVRGSKARIIRFALTITVMLATVGCDQVSKFAARSFLSHTQPVSFFGGSFQLTLHQNPGAFLSFGSELPNFVRFLLFSIVCGSAVIAGIFYLIVKKQLSYRLVFAASLLLGGAIGNQIDRFACHGLVTDFLFLSLGPLHTGVFNVADMALMFGSGLWLIASWREWKDMREG